MLAEIMYMYHGRVTLYFVCFCFFHKYTITGCKRFVMKLFR